MSEEDLKEPCKTCPRVDFCEPDEPCYTLYLYEKFRKGERENVKTVWVNNVSAQSKSYNYVRITYQINVEESSQPIHHTWLHNISRERVVKLLCNYLVRTRQTPQSVTFDEHYGLTVDMAKTYLWSTSCSEVMVTSGSHTDFGSGFSLEEFKLIKKQVEEYWSSKKFLQVRERAKKREKSVW